MWVLRRPSDITQITCINLIEPFTIGRIECSFNITDDKSVSRRHASITFPPSIIFPLLTDFNSKFGTFVNSNRVTTPVQLKHGDTVKFGGATSEFVVESKDFKVYVKSQKTKEMFKELKDTYGIEVISSLKDALYLVIDDNEQINEVDSDLISAFLSCKYIVSPSYFAQLLQSNVMSLGLIQPSISSKLFPTDCWLPRKERFNVLRNAFEGIKRFILCGGDKHEHVIKVISNALGIETKSLQSHELRDLKFNELFIVSSIYPDTKNLIDPIRTVKYQSIIEAVINCDGKLIEIDTIYPDKPKEREREHVILFTDKPMALAVESKELEPIVTVDNPLSLVNIPDKLSQEVEYKGSSLTAVIPMPASLLRPPQSLPSSRDDPNPKKPKFIKCHPRHRIPGTIPALIGPDQLQPCQSSNIVNNNGTQGLKRRVLVKDSWLAEDDLVGEDKSDTIIVKENKQERSNINEKIVKPIEQRVMNKSNQQDTKNSSNNTATIPTKSTIPPTPTIPPLPPTPTIPPTIHPLPPLTHTTPPTNTKFQSSFFKNLSKGK